MNVRLVTLKQAADYCGMSPPIFRRLCPVRPIRFSERLIRYDLVDIDRWIDDMHPKTVNHETTTEYWLAKFGESIPDQIAGKRRTDLNDGKKGNRRK
jgi:predicted DNA-binding transcriptional regulator AlpA